MVLTTRTILSVAIEMFTLSSRLKCLFSCFSSQLFSSVTGRRDVSEFNHSNSFTTLHPVREKKKKKEDSTNRPFTGTVRLSAVVIKESHRRLFKDPHLIHQGAAWQGPRRHLKGTTVEKINLAASLLGPAAESRERKER